MIQLISVGALLSESWQFLKKEWKPLSKLTLWVFGLSLINSAASVLLVLVQTSTNNTGWGVLRGLVSIVIALFSIWFYIRLFDAILKRDQGHALDIQNQTRAKQLILPMLLIGLLTILAVVLGLILLVIPGIWLAYSFSFAAFFLLEDDLHGREALKASYRLVKGRWWSIWWKKFVISLVIGLSIVGVYLVVLALLFAAVAGTMALHLGTVSVLLLSILGIALLLAIAASITLFVTPFAFITQAKLFHSLKATQTHSTEKTS